MTRTLLPILSDGHMGTGAPREKALGDRPSKSVLIVLMPWAPPSFPGLGPTLVRSILIRDEIPCDILYGNLVFSCIYNGDPFIERVLPKIPLGEIAFTPYYFGTSKADAAAKLMTHVRRVAPDPSVHKIERYMQIVDWAGECLDRLIHQTPWDKYDIVGFSVMMQQTVASLALAKRIKERSPATRILFGGANAARPMGRELIRSFPELDFVLEGEVDATITPFVDQVRARLQGPYDVPGLLYRDTSGVIRSTCPPTPFHDLDSLPVPDYRPYEHQLNALRLDYIQPYLPFETSRGCWWGEKHHCTFCGIDDEVLRFRSKSDDRVVKEILALAAQNQRGEFFAVDSIINHHFYKTLLPRLGRLREEKGYDFTFFFECKSNISRQNVQLFHYGGVNAVQPGVESFSDHVLKLMDKGSTGARQIQCLKMLAEVNVLVNWNLIYQIPFETIDDYEETLAVIPFLYHLPPLHDEGLIPMQVNRYAPYHNAPDTYELFNVRPQEHYDHVFPKPGIDIEKLAFYFDYEHKDHHNDELKRLYLKVHEAIEAWRRHHRPDSLLQFRGPGFLQIVDRRVFGPSDESLDESRPRVLTLESPWSDIFVFCDEVRTETDVLRRFQDQKPSDEVLAFLDRMYAGRLIYRSRSRQLINLPLLKDTRERYQPSRSAREDGPSVESRLRQESVEGVVVQHVA